MVTAALTAVLYGLGVYSSYRFVTSPWNWEWVGWEAVFFLCAGIFSWTFI